MSFPILNSKIKLINCFVRLYSLAKKTHYDVLNLRKNCTDKEIKDAFIQLSKEYHPDRNKDVRAQEKFVRIVEAYNTLSKPGARARYDSMNFEAKFHEQSYSYKPKETYEHSTYYNFYQEPRRDAYSEANKHYYGVVGLKKLPNLAIIALCFGFAIVGLVLQMVIIRGSFLRNKRIASEKSKMLAAELEKVRTAARENGNELQTRLLMEKIVNGSNPVVATATLGQALANEKK